MRSRRIAFITPEFVTEYADGGGLGTYVCRMAQALLAAGHAPEVFVTSEHGPETLTHLGIPVHRVPVPRKDLLVRLAWHGAGILGSENWRPGVHLYASAKGLADALERREREAPFDLVQSADYLGSGLLVKRKGSRPHLVRCSTAADLYAASDDDVSPARRWWVRFERAAIRRADKAYAPSACVAEHLSRVCGRPVGVVRPPALIDVEADTAPGMELPARFFLHFGQLRARKGTALLAQALPLVWESAPDFHMVWAGRAEDVELAAWRKAWGEHASQVLHLPPLRKPVLYAVLRRAEAAVLPSQVDNLPNTVIESLLFGIPVIGSDGASVDELVEQDLTGELVALGDARALAHGMLKVWRGESKSRKGFTWDGPIAREMRPENAVRQLLRFGGLP
jgi:glycosyltransferase involved in cell wall biosynthesis